VFGAEKHGYFEAVCNHDAICFRVVDDAQARRIYNKIASIPLLRRNDFIITNHPSLDDMYTPPDDWLWKFGTWVNGGHWSTCEARMVMAYYRLGEYEDARRSMKKLLIFARRFRMDNPLVNFGNAVYQPKQPINLCYDSFGPPAALVRGLFELLYTADGLTLLPHIPSGITELQQKFPIRFGVKKLYLSTIGSGPVTEVKINGQKHKSFDSKSIFLSYEQTPNVAQIQIALGGAKLGPPASLPTPQPLKSLPAPKDDFWKGPLAELRLSVERLQGFYGELAKEKLAESYEAEHAKLVIDYVAVINNRIELLEKGKIKPLPETPQAAADKSYIDTAQKLCEGLEKVLESYAASDEPHKKRIYQIWHKQN
jgi:hypothetical protein